MIGTTAGWPGVASRRAHRATVYGISQAVWGTCQVSTLPACHMQRAVYVPQNGLALVPLGCSWLASRTCAAISARRVSTSATQGPPGQCHVIKGHGTQQLNTTHNRGQVSGTIHIWYLAAACK